MNTNRQWLFKQTPETGVSKEQCFELAETHIPELFEGQFLVANQFFSIDPAMVPWMFSLASYMVPQEVGQPMLSWATGKVVASKHPQYQIGDQVSGTFSWQDYCVSNGIDLNGDLVARVPEGASGEAAMSALWISGLTAFIGLFDTAHPRPGDTILVSGAAGSVGNLVGQFAKLAGCRVVGIAGSNEKCDWLKDALGFDAAINYKTEPLLPSIQAACPEGVDIYWDNVGGEMLDAALAALATGARVVMCGFISIYDDFSKMPALTNWISLAGNRAIMNGFNVTDHKDKYDTALRRIKHLLDANKIDLAVDVLDGFEKLPASLDRIYNGKNTGKQLVRNCANRAD